MNAVLKPLETSFQGVDCVVADMSLADWGRKELTIAEHVSGTHLGVKGKWWVPAGTEAPDGQHVPAA